MGNIGSQIGHINPRPAVEEQQWAHSFPRTQQQRPFQHKVLPEREVGIKLRPTNNGEILQSGGTLTGRHHQNRHSLEKENEPGPGPAVSPRSPQSKTYLSNQRDPLHKAGHRYPQALECRQSSGNNLLGFREQMKKFGSEPDLRYSAQEQENLEMREKARLKKKYRAPPPPKITNAASGRNDWKENLNGETNSPIRRARLFKTRAETKKNYSSPVHNHKPLDFKEKAEPSPPKQCSSQNESCEKNHEPVQLRQRSGHGDIRANRLSLPEVKLPRNSTTDFQQELKEATKRLRDSKILEASRESINNEKNQNDMKEKLKTLDHNIKSKDNLRQKLKQLAKEHHNFTAPIDCIRGEGSGKESSSPDQSPPDRNSRNIPKDNNPKTFYFGMDNPVEEDFNNEIIDNFTSSLHVTSRTRRCSSESDLSSELEMDECQTSRNGIDLHLRPILPKKQLEIPRFSPAAAWRLLSTFDANPEVSTITSDDVQAFIEERIEKFARPPPPTMQMGPRSTNDKSGDSGISGDAGDAGPAGFDDGPDITSSRSNLQRSSPFGGNQGLSWTPQQDLGDDSSLEEGTNHTDEAYRQKFANKPHVFSLSLPRDNHLAAYMVDRQMQASTSLQKIKRSVSGVLNNLAANNRKMAHSNTNQNENWFLSKSAPNSLNNGFNSLDVKNSNKSDDNENSLVPNPKHGSGRLMYLPEFSDFVENKIRSRMKEEEEKDGRLTKEDRKHRLSVYSKSCENISIDMKSSSEPEDLQDPPPRIIPGEEQWRANKKPKRFTFQSTVRQIERKRLAEKLSREAERKEMQRLRELEAMQKVEEEFQRKRAREKANIRHQLRLFNMDDSSWSSIPADMSSKDGPVPRRPEPDGAVSSSATSSPSLPLQQKSPEINKKFQKNKKLLEVKHKRRANSESSEENKVKAPVTQVLSEYRQPQREYKEYRGSTRYLNDLSDGHNKQTTVHPQVTCNMPKAAPQSSAKNVKNFRKDFVHGIKSTRSGGSTYSEDSQSRGNSPRLYHNKHSPTTRF